VLSQHSAFIIHNCLLFTISTALMRFNLSYMCFRSCLDRVPSSRYLHFSNMEFTKIIKKLISLRKWVFLIGIILYLWMIRVLKQRRIRYLEHLYSKGPQNRWIVLRHLAFNRFATWSQLSGLLGLFGLLGLCTRRSDASSCILASI